MFDTKCIFSAHIMCMVHTPFKESFFLVKVGLWVGVVEVEVTVQ